MQLASKKRTLIFTVIVTTVVVCSMLSTALTTALPQIMEDFSLNAASGQWLTSIYSLVMGILVLCTAYLIKRFPTKNLYISSLLLFSIGVILNGFAQSFTVMMLGRIMQAAGIIVDHWGWRMIFYSLAVLCIIALVVAFFAMDNVLENEHSKLDIPFLNIRVLSHRRMRFATIGSVLFYLNMMALAVINPLFIQSACGRSATMSGLLMMPPLTWGVSTLDKQDIASGQSLITSLRTISGALGSTIFMSLEAILEDSIGIMAAMQISYVGMTFVGVLVLVSAIAARRCD